MNASIRSRAPSASSAFVRRVMQANRSRNTTPERLLRAALHSRGFRFRVDTKLESGFRCKADIVFPRLRVCVFIDGCFWHGCPAHYSCPKTNTSWWEEKIRDNVARDAAKTATLKRLGWKVLRIWEHEIRSNLDGCIRLVRITIDQAVARIGDPSGCASVTSKQVS